MKVSVGQDDEPCVLGVGVASGLLLADKRVELLGLGFQYGDWETPIIEQQVVRVPVGRLLEVVAQRIKDLFLDFDVYFKGDIGRPCVVVEESPTGSLEKVVDQDSSSCFFGHGTNCSYCQSTMYDLGGDLTSMVALHGI